MVEVCNIYSLPQISISVNRIIFMHHILRGCRGAIIGARFLLTRAMCMQDWLEEIAFVCFVSLDGEDDERERARAGRSRDAGAGGLEGCEKGSGKVVSSVMTEMSLTKKKIRRETLRCEVVT